jgi:hypothetical protein|tara:strand:- start:83 stop:565 length:483 start_codon:yes stop_codon:yes gene_type:complete
MADKKVSALTAATTLASADLAHVITSVATTPTNNKVTLLNTFNKVPTFLGFSGTGIQAYTAATSAVTATGGLILVTTPSTAATPALADGVAGQRVTVVLDVDGGGNAIITPDTLNGGASITLTDVGDAFTAVFTATRGWVVTSEASGVAPVSTTLVLTKA